MSLLHKTLFIKPSTPVISQASPPPSKSDWRPQSDPQNPSSATTTRQDGWAVFENATYRISAGDNNNVVVHNKQTGESYHLTGANMKVDGQDGFTTAGHTTYSLQDGTKLTVEMAAIPNPHRGFRPPQGPSYVPSKITITNGNYGAQITGIDSKTAGDLQTTEFKGQGKTLDLITRDGNTLHENPIGRGFVGIDRNGQVGQVNQSFINANDEVISGKPHDLRQGMLNNWLSQQLGASAHPAGHAAPIAQARASTTMQDGKAVFENANYRVTAGDNNIVFVNNKKTGETYKLYGSETQVDGQAGVVTSGKTTYALQDGTKITVEKEALPKSGGFGKFLKPTVHVPSKITITDGNYGVQISGIDSNTAGDLRINEMRGKGRMLDRITSDGNVLHENPLGQGFLGIDNNGQVRNVDQQFVNETDELRSGKPLTWERHWLDARLSAMLQQAARG